MSSAADNPVAPVKGNFSKEEMSLLMDSLESFKRSEGATDEDLCPSLRGSKEKLVGEKSNAYRIWRDLYALMPYRTPKSIYQAVQRKLRRAHLVHGAGTWTAADIVQLDAFYKRIGPNWSEIGRHMSRPGDACQKKYERYLKKTELSAAREYTPQETELLVSKMKLLTGASTVLEVGRAKVHPAPVWEELRKVLKYEFTVDHIKKQWRAIWKLAKKGQLPVSDAATAAPLAASVSSETNCALDKNEERMLVLAALVDAVCPYTSQTAHTFTVDDVDWAKIGEEVGCSRPHHVYKRLLKRAIKKEQKELAAFCSTDAQLSHFYLYSMPEDSAVSIAELPCVSQVRRMAQRFSTSALAEEAASSNRSVTRTDANQALLDVCQHHKNVRKRGRDGVDEAS